VLAAVQNRLFYSSGIPFLEIERGYFLKKNIKKTADKSRNQFCFVCRIKKPRIGQGFRSLFLIFLCTGI
jgi:hypothetical protein